MRALVGFRDELQRSFHEAGSRHLSGVMRVGGKPLGVLLEVGLVDSRVQIIEIVGDDAAHPDHLVAALDRAFRIAPEGVIPASVCEVVLAAEEAFFCGTGWEITPITSVDRLAVGTGEVGPITKALQRAYFDIVHGREEAYTQWRTPVYEELGSAS